MCDTDDDRVLRSDRVEDPPASHGLLVPLCEDDDCQATGEPRQRDRRWFQETFVDGVVEQHPNRCCGDESANQGNQEASADRTLADQALEDFEDSLPRHQKDGQDGAELDDDRIGVGRLLVGIILCADVHETLGDE